MLLLVDDREPVASGPSGPDQGVIEEARRRQRRRLARIAGAIAVFALVAALLVVSSSGGHHRSRISAKTQPSPATPVVASARRQEPLRLSPDLTGGSVGWCIVWGGGGGCGMVPRANTPILDRESSFGSSQPDLVTFLITAPDVASIRMDGNQTILTTRLPGQPSPLRSARILTPAIPDPAHPGRYLRPAAPSLVALDARRRVLRQGLQSEKRISGWSVEVRSWQRPQAPTQGPCQIKAGGLPGLAPRWGHVASIIQPLPGLVGQAFFSCMDTEYMFHGYGA